MVARYGGQVGTYARPSKRAHRWIMIEDSNGKRKIERVICAVCAMDRTWPGARLTCEAVDKLDRHPRFRGQKIMLAIQDEA